MDVSRIEAFNPNTKINWQILTAREILEFKNQGVEVPDIYLVWAQDFINSLDAVDIDTTTYEQAHSPTGDNSGNVNNEGVKEDSPVPPEEPDSTDGTDNAGSGENPDGTVQQPAEEIVLNNAQTRRKQKEEDGTSLRSIAISFSRYSISNFIKSIISRSRINSVKSDSNDEIRELDRNMRSFLQKAGIVQNNLKTEVNNLNKGDASSYGKIMQYQNELTALGQKGHGDVSAREAEFNGFNADLNSEEPIQTDAQDFGTETVDIGQDLIEKSKHENVFSSIIDKIIGAIAIVKGKLSKSAASKGTSNLNSAAAVNTSNLSSASSYHGQVTAKTGVEFQTPQAEKADKTQEENKSGEGNNPASENKTDTEETDSSKKVQNGIDNGSDASLDEILKRKIKRGEIPD